MIKSTRINFVIKSYDKLAIEKGISNNLPYDNINRENEF
jgi:hypothetical protein